MSTLSGLAGDAAAEALEIFGAFHPAPGDGAPEGCRTLVLLGPREPAFWPHVTAQPEFADGARDPLDRWSARVISALAGAHRGTAVFPFGGPPHAPFPRWALASGRAWSSPVGLLVHESAGLMVSYRGAIALDWRADLPPPPAQPPCASCPGRPCETACPAAALDPDGYDLARCHGFLDTPAGKACLEGGCRVRCACPVSQSYGRLPAQSAYHMAVFHR